jgi:rubrerythrin
MTEPVYKQGWSPDDIAWDKFDAAKAEPWIVDAIKSAALVEYNAPDYVGYLKRVFPDPAFHPIIEQWGHEERQHGKVLGRWAELADPAFKLDEAFARFRAGYRPDHFDSDNTESVRGSKRGEMIARCVVESGTSTYYTAIKEATAEPVLQEIAGRIAADEYRHYKLFYETLQTQHEADLPFWRKFLIALGRATESDDDEISFSRYCATVPSADMARRPYDRAAYSRDVFVTTLRIYRRRHIDKLTRMIAKAVGADPQGRMVKLTGATIWRLLRVRAGLIGASPAPVA